MNLKNRHFLCTRDWNDQEIEALLECAADLKARAKRDIPHRYLESKSLLMFVETLSPLIADAFETGMFQLGGHVSRMHHAGGMGAKDIAKTWSRRANGIGIAQAGGDLTGTLVDEVARHSTVPVINLGSAVYYPVQAVADLMTARERLGQDLTGLRFVVSWAYSPWPQRSVSVAQSLVLLMTRLGMDVTLAHPPEFELMPPIIGQAKANAKESGGSLNFADAMEPAFEGAHVIYPFCWGPTEVVIDPNEMPDEVGEDDQSPMASTLRARRIAMVRMTAITKVLAKYKDWICDEKRMDLTSEDCFYMHCLPAATGYEVVPEIIDGPRSVVYDQSENVLHMAKAIMVKTM